MDNQTANNICLLLEDQKVLKDKFIDLNAFMRQDAFKDISLDVYENGKEIIIKELEKLYFLSNNPNSTENIILQDKIVEMLYHKILIAISRNILDPLANIAINKATQSASNIVHKELNKW